MREMREEMQNSSPPYIFSYGVGWVGVWVTVGLCWVRLGSAISEQKIKHERRSSALLSLTHF